MKKALLAIEVLVFLSVLWFRQYNLQDGAWAAGIFAAAIGLVVAVGACAKNGWLST